ncbi:MAG TPA: hypothetical protein PKL04_06625 [Methanofastidiosum sp.]|nr:hypothetical protein [Methanofastidiosum sp.]
MTTTLTKKQTKIPDLDSEPLVRSIYNTAFDHLTKTITPIKILDFDFEPLVRSIYDTVFNHLTDECSAYWKQWEKERIILENLAKEGVDVSREYERAPNGDSLLDYIQFARKDIFYDQQLFDLHDDELFKVVCFYIIEKIDQLENCKYTKRAVVNKSEMCCNMITYNYIDPNCPDIPLVLFEMPNIQAFDELNEPVSALYKVENFNAIKLIIKGAIDEIIENLKKDKYKSKLKSARNI